MFIGGRIGLEAVPTPSCHPGSLVATPASASHASEAASIPC